jgi:hypothetical protein
MYVTPLNATATWGQRTGSVADIAPVREALHGPDEWFTLEVIAQGDHQVTRVNGKTAVDVRDGRFQKGRLALVGSQPGTVVRFRRIEVKELAPGG